MGGIETVEAEKMGWLDLPRVTSYPTFPGQVIWCFSFAVSFKNTSFTDPRNLANFQPKVVFSDVTKSAISEKKNPTD